MDDIVKRAIQEDEIARRDFDNWQYKRQRQQQQQREREEPRVRAWLARSGNDEVRNTDQRDQGGNTGTGNDAAWERWGRAIAYDEAWKVADDLVEIIGGEIAKFNNKQTDDIQRWARQQIAVSVFETVKRQLTERSAALEQRIAALEQRGLSEDLKEEFRKLRDDLIQRSSVDDDRIVPLLKLKGRSDAA